MRQLEAPVMRYASLTYQELAKQFVKTTLIGSLCQILILIRFVQPLETAMTKLVRIVPSMFVTKMIFLRTVRFAGITKAATDSVANLRRTWTVISLETVITSVLSRFAQKVSLRKSVGINATIIDALIARSFFLWMVQTLGGIVVKSLIFVKRRPVPN